MRKLLTLMSAMVVLCGISAADEWHKTFEVNGAPSLTITTTDGNIRVDTWDQNRIEARVMTETDKIGPGHVRVTDSQGGNHVTLDVHIPDVHFGIWVHHRTDIEIHMPKQGVVDLQTHDGKISLANFKGEMHLKSGDGAQQADNVDGSLDATAGDGSIHIDVPSDFAADVEAHTGDGHLHFDMPVMVNGSMSQHDLRGKLNGGGGVLRLRSGDGSIYVSKA